MANNPHFKLTARHGALDAIRVSVGTTCAFVLYAGAQPADVSTATTAANVSVASLSCASGFATAAASALTANTITDDSSAAGGSANWFSIEDNGGNRIIDGEVGTSGADLNLNSQTITTGATVSITSFTVTFAA
jgi:hypothetical protein